MNFHTFSIQKTCWNKKLPVEQVRGISPLVSGTPYLSQPCEDARLCMMNQAAAPRHIEQYQPDGKGEIPRDNGGKITGTPALIDPEGNPVENQSSQS